MVDKKGRCSEQKGIIEKVWTIRKAIKNKNIQGGKVFHKLWQHLKYYGVKCDLKSQVTFLSDIIKG